MSGLSRDVSSRKWRWTVLFSVLAFLLVGTVATAQTPADVYTGCLTPGGNLTNVAIDDEPLKECKGNMVEVSWSEQGSIGPSIAFYEARLASLVTVLPGATFVSNVFCDPGDQVIGGGYEVRRQPANPPHDPIAGVFVSQNSQILAAPGYWGWKVAGVNTTNLTLYVDIRSICADYEPLRP